MVTTTIRFPEELYQEVSDFAREHDFSKNQVIKMAVRYFLQERKDDGYRESRLDGKGTIG